MLWAALSFRLDLAAFGLVCLGLLAVLHVGIRRGGRRGVPRASWWLLLAIILLGALLAELVGRFQAKAIRGRLQACAGIYAQETRRLGHAHLPTDAKPDDPLYLSLIEAQRSWLRVNPLAVDVYTLRKRPDGTYMFLVDSETDYDGDGLYNDPREQRTPIGTLFDDLDEHIERAFAGQPSFDAEPWTDRWGTWVSAYYPILRPDGQVDAVLGVDYHARDWLMAIALHRAIALLFTAIAIAGHAIGGVAMWHYRRLLAERTELAMHDRLTGLPNRILLHEHLSRALKQREHNPEHALALIFLDLDCFKIINDSLGHAVGDLLLIAVAKRLCSALDYPALSAGPAGSVLPARLGGDEFVVLLKSIRNTQDATAVAQRIGDTFSKPFVLAGHEVRVSASIGIATSHGEYQAAGELLRDADTAMYNAKSSGKARFVFFDQQMRDRVVARLRAEQDLRKALELQQLSLALQPIVNLDTGRLVGFETLLRWTHPTRGMVSPAEFIPLAEETGLILPIGEWVLEEVCRILLRWRTQYHRTEVFITANVSRRQMDAADWVDRFQQIITRTGADPTQLRLEITESTVMSNPEASIQALKQLRLLGIGIYVDDFGTGHSSLACLHRFPFSGLKLDRAFVASVSANRDYMAVVSAIVSLAYSFNMQVTAEGVEEPEQVVLLQSLGCHDAQGYYFAKPMPLHEAERVLLEGLPARSLTPTSAEPHAHPIAA